ncbi:MAG: peptidylprolyl isomerase [Nitrosomonadales bacterium]|nr:peptidylprolyl isomerase [Nitrosomonadales bacterium]
MLRIFKLAAFAILGALAASPVYAENKAVAVVNGTPIPQERLELHIKAAAAQGQQDTPELRKAIRDRLIDSELLSQEAIKKDLDKQPETAQNLILTRQTVLANAFMLDYVKGHPIGEDVLTQAYETAKKSAGNKEYNVRHILVEKEADAKSIAAKLKKGGKFDKLAEANSKDAGSKSRGGDLGWVPVGSIPTTYVKPFADAVMNLTKGQVSEPVQSQFGWHVIKLEDVRDLKLPAYEEVKPQIMQSLQQQAVQKMLAELRSKAKIE